MMYKRDLEHNMGDASASRKRIFPEYRDHKMWAKNKTTNVPVLTETILRNEKAKHKKVQVFKSINFSEFPERQAATEENTG